MRKNHPPYFPGVRRRRTPGKVEGGGIKSVCVATHLRFRPGRARRKSDGVLPTRTIESRASHRRSPQQHNSQRTQSPVANVRFSHYTALGATLAATAGYVNKAVHRNGRAGCFSTCRVFHARVSDPGRYVLNSDVRFRVRFRANL